jgi:ankyrin repeat protein
MNLLPPELLGQIVARAGVLCASTNRAFASALKDPEVLAPALIETVGDPKTTLWRALERKQVRAVCVLASRVPPDLLSQSTARKGGNTPLHAAVKYLPGTDAMVALLDAGAPIDATNDLGDTPLHSAVSFNHMNKARTLLGRTGIDPNALNAHRFAPLHLAVLVRCGIGMIRALLNGGADPEVRNDKGFTALHLAVELPVDSSKVVEALLRTGANPYGGPDGNSALHLAVARGNLSILQALLRTKQMDINCRNALGSTALQLAVLTNKDDIAMELLAWGADPNVPGARGDTALLTLLVRMEPHLNPSYERVVRAMLASKADPNKVNNSGFTPFFYFFFTWPRKTAASDAIRHSVLRALLDHGADIDLPNAIGWTPRDFAPPNVLLGII